jgi:glutamine amidotransferase
MLALRSARPESVAGVLLDAPDCLRALSHEHRHGWGIAQYHGAQPQVVRGSLAAHEDRQFTDVARSVNSSCVLAHVRKASVGAPTISNSHPFYFRRWAFAHNGTVQRFEQCQPELDAMIAPGYLGLVRGDTDSERCFALFLTRLEALGAFALPPLEVAACALAQTIARVRAVSPDPATTLTLVVTDGQLLVGTRSGARELGFSFLDGERLLIASQAPSSDLPWTELDDGDLVATDSSLRLRRHRLCGDGLSSP